MYLLVIQWASHDRDPLNLELSSVALGAKVVKVSDEFFAEAFHLLKVDVSSTASVSLQNTFKSLSIAST